MCTNHRSCTASAAVVASRGRVLGGTCRSSDVCKQRANELFSELHVRNAGPVPIQFPLLPRLLPYRCLRHMYGCWGCTHSFLGRLPQWHRLPALTAAGQSPLSPPGWAY